MRILLVAATAQEWASVAYAETVRAGVTGHGSITLAGHAVGRRSPDDITIFDSTGLAIQDLAIALAAMEHAGELDLPRIDL